ncbi:MAG: phage holin family protein [Clostridia bacterium]
MDNFLDILNQYARAELLILVPVLSFLGKVLVSSKIDNKRIPLILTGISILLCGSYTFATVAPTTFPTILLACFTSITQGILFVGASVFGRILLTPSYIAKMISPQTKAESAKVTKKTEQCEQCENPCVDKDTNCEKAQDDKAFCEKDDCDENIC